MPCFDPFTNSPEIVTETVIKEVVDDREIRRLTGLLCEATELLEANHLLINGSADLRNFYVGHLAVDKQRLIAERTKVLDSWYDNLSEHEKVLVNLLELD